ncbi:MAG TPA: hypothetical protein VGL11_10245 [Candidatus Binatia bacterium]|jgi:hypothetical protein
MKLAVETAAAFVMMIALLCSQPARAQETQEHWLIGRWDGDISGYIGRGSASRTLRVTEVAADGIAKGLWYVTGQKPYLALILVEGAEVTIATAGHSRVELTREGNNSLVGKYIPENGEALPLKLTRTERPSAAGEK